MSWSFAWAWSRHAAGVAACAVLVACAGSAAPRPGGAAAALYGQLDQAGSAYENAWQRVQDGDTDTAPADLTRALDELAKASTTCAHTAGCDAQRFFATYQHLLRLGGGEDEEEGLAGEAGPAASGSTAGSGAALLAQARHSVTLLRGQKLSELIAMNGPVKAALEMWLTQWRPALMDAYVNYSYLRSEMEPAYEKANLPEALLFGIMAKESGGKVHAVSRSGAAGPLQFMYTTGLRFGLNNTSGFDLRFDPTAAARANAEYIDEQLKVFDNNLEMTLAAYNGGEGRMRRLVDGDTGASFYDPKIYNQLSPETRSYVPEVLAAAWLFLHPDSYNLKFPKIDGTLATVNLERPASLAELTVCLGSADGMDEGWFRTLRNLNPRMDPQVEQVSGTPLQLPQFLAEAYRQRCVTGPWPILASDLHAASLALSTAPQVASTPASPRTRGTRSYRVRRGDTLSSIAHRLSCANVEDLARMNDIKDGHLRAGHTIKVPAC